MPKEEEYPFLKKFEEIGKRDFEKWINIKKLISDVEKRMFICNDTAYTPHDIDNHVMGLYRNLGYIINDEDYNKMGGEALFYLSCAVLLHDIAMAINPTYRACHAIAGAAVVEYGGIIIDILSESDYLKYDKETIIPFIKQKYSDAIKKLLIACTSEREREIISLIIAAHSDIKINNKERISLIQSDHIGIEEGLAGNKIDIKVLAALVRLADELDVTQMRINGYNYDLNNMNETSRPHWRKLELIKQIVMEGRTIKLIVNERQLVDPFDFSKVSNIDIDFSYLHEIEVKISNELKNLNDIAFQKSRWFTNYFDKVEVCFSKSKYSENYSLFNQEILGRIVFKSNRISEETEEQVNQFIIKNNLFLEGHYEINDKFYSRDYIETYPIVTDVTMLGEINKAFYNYLYNQIVFKILKRNGINLSNTNELSAQKIKNDLKMMIEENYKEDIINELRDVFLIGIGFDGIIMASNFSLTYNMPFTYVLPYQKGKIFDSHDKVIIDEIKNRDIVLFISAIITGGTIAEVINELDSKKILSADTNIIIFTILDREPCDLLPECVGCNKSILAERTKNLGKSRIQMGNFHAITKKFKVEICKKNPNECLQCQFTNKNHNRKLL